MNYFGETELGLSLDNATAEFLLKAISFKWFGAILFNVYIKLLGEII